MKRVIIPLVIEKNDGMLWGRVEGKGNFMPTPYGETYEMLVENLKAAVADYISHEGKTDKFWSTVNWKHADLDVKYDLEAFFEENNYLSISGIAQKAGLNESLLRQYAVGKKHASERQIKKIEETVRKIGEALSGINLIAGNNLAK